jgi:AcrR family transcriptional regulator
LSLQVNINRRLFLRNPEKSDLGKKIIQHSIELIHEIGYEAFTFKKLAILIETTEAGIYRYFENKHRLLFYLVDWYWNWLEYQVAFHTQNIKPAELKIKKLIEILSKQVEDDIKTDHVDEKLLYEIVVKEGAKVYLTHHVNDDKEFELFKPYEDLCSRIAQLILAYNQTYPFPRSLSSTIVEMAHFQHFFAKNLPALTDIEQSKDKNLVSNFIEHLVFSTLKS